MTDPRHFATAFGLGWRSDIALPHFDAAPVPEGDPPFRSAVEVRKVSGLAARTAVRRVNRGHVYADGVRLAWRDEAMFDMFAGERIDYLPGAGWTGAMPPAFYSTLAALTLAWRGAVPLHATAIEIGGRALLIAGSQGKGKSTTAAALLAHGAQLISDDLTVVDVSPGDAPWVLQGRPGIRLHRETARRLVGAEPGGASIDTRGKSLVCPLARCRNRRVPLGAILLLGRERAAIDPVAAAAQMPAQLFRPRWLAAMPGHARRVALAMSLAGRVPVGGLPSIERFGENELDVYTGRVLAFFHELARA